MAEAVLTTNRLILHTASCSEMKSFIGSQTDDILKTAYQEMLDGAAAHPDMYEWYALWMIELPDGTHVGELSFKGMSDDGLLLQVKLQVQRLLRLRPFPCATEASSVQINTSAPSSPSSMILLRL